MSTYRHLRKGEDGCYYYITEDVIRSSLGNEYRITRANKVPRIDDNLLRSVCYLYPSEEEAEKGERGGGTGFLVRVRSSYTNSGEFNIYAVTCKHVIKGVGKDAVESPVLRMHLNDWRSHSLSPKPEILTFAASQWKCSETDDLAVISLGRKKHSEIDAFSRFCVDVDTFLTREKMAEMDIGLGDDVQMIGRFVDHDGKEKQRPSVRSGTISVMPDKDDPVEFDDDGPDQEAFLVEMHSVSGFSGSLVTWTWPIAEILWNHPSIQISPRNPVFPESNYFKGPWVVGIDVGHFSSWNEIRDKKTRILSKEYEYKLSSGLAVVMPAWLIHDMLYLNKFVTERQEDDEQMIKRKRKNVAERDMFRSKKQDQGVTPESFENALKKASRKVSEPVKETKETSE